MSLPKLSHQQLKVRILELTVLVKWKNLLRRKTLAQSWWGCYSYLRPPEDVWIIVRTCWKLMNYMPKSFTHALACPWRNHGLSPPYVWYSASQTESEREAVRSTGKTEHYVILTFIISNTVSQWISSWGRNVDRETWLSGQRFVKIGPTPPWCPVW